MAKKTRPVNHYSRGLFHRLAGASVGLVISALLVIGLTVSESLPTAQVKISRFSFTHSSSDSFPALPPTVSYGVSVPALHLEYSPTNTPVPIASITKMMTAYVALRSVKASDQASKCHLVDSTDVAAYEHEVATGQSTAFIQEGESICFPDLMRGLMVHSASDYALILSRMFAPSTAQFVAKMNAEAKRLAMTNTVYSDPTGIQASNTSTPRDQLVLTAKLMRYQLIRDAVRLPSIELPVAGRLNSFTPYAGMLNVIGVKSGRTDAAGGCDVMATQMTYRGKSYLALVAVFGARGGDLLKPAGDDALAISDAISSLIDAHRISSHEIVGAITWEGQTVHIVFAHPVQTHGWSFEKNPDWKVVMRRINSARSAGSVVGWIYGPKHVLVGELVTTASLKGPSLLQRML